MKKLIKFNKSFVYAFYVQFNLSKSNFYMRLLKKISRQPLLINSKKEIVMKIHRRSRQRGNCIKVRQNNSKVSVLKRIKERKVCFICLYHVLHILSRFCRLFYLSMLIKIKLAESFPVLVADYCSFQCDKHKTITKNNLTTRNFVIRNCILNKIIWCYFEGSTLSKHVWRSVQKH